MGEPEMAYRTRASPTQIRHLSMVGQLPRSHYTSSARQATLQMVRKRGEIVHDRRDNNVVVGDRGGLVPFSGTAEMDCRNGLPK